MTDDDPRKLEGRRLTECEGPAELHRLGNGRAAPLIITDDRLPGPAGDLAGGLVVVEAVYRARHWWNTIARHHMPDIGVQRGDWQTPSGVLNGLPWEELDRLSTLMIVKHWYTYVWIPTELGEKR